MKSLQTREDDDEVKYLSIFDETRDKSIISLALHSEEMEKALALLSKENLLISNANENLRLYFSTKDLIKTLILLYQHHFLTKKHFNSLKLSSEPNQFSFYFASLAHWNILTTKNMEYLNELLEAKVNHPEILLNSLHLSKTLTAAAITLLKNTDSPYKLLPLLQRSNTHFPRSYWKIYAEGKDDPIQCAKALLADYVKGGKFHRICYGHWNRHYVPEALAILQKIADGKVNDIFTLVNLLNQIDTSSHLGGSFRRRTAFIILQFQQHLASPLEEKEVTSPMPTLR